MHIVHSLQHRLHDTRNVTVDGQQYWIEELPERVELILEAVRAAGIGTIGEARDHGIQPLREAHTADYLDFLATIYTRGSHYYGKERPLFPETFSSRAPARKPEHPIGQLGYYSFATFSPILAGTWQAAYWSAQTALTAARHTQETGETSYALCRPPGHHAGKALYGGFCYLNNAAIAARALKRRLAILDIDYHHGNGTQEIFYADPAVLYCSIHAHPDLDYPYFWGGAEERGAGPGFGMNHNFPLPKGTGDSAYLETLETAIAQVQRFQPEFFLVSLGFDILQGDPAGGFDLSLPGLGEIARRISRLTHRGIPTILVQEGGYNLGNLGEYAVTFLQHFQDPKERNP